MLGGCTFALTLGGKHERIGATAYLLCWLFSSLVRMQMGENPLPSTLVLMLDTGLLLTFASLVWKAPNNWPVWATALQLLVVTLQFLYLIDFKPPTSAYNTIQNFTALGIIASLITGTVIAWQERAVLTSDYDDLGRYS